jgi:hypothetical protein
MQWTHLTLPRAGAVAAALVLAAAPSVFAQSSRQAITLLNAPESAS